MIVPATAFIDLSGNQFAGLVIFPPGYQFTLADTTPPLLASHTPAHNAVDQQTPVTITFTFVENVQAGTGNILITPSGGNTHYNGNPYVNQPLLIAIQDETQITFDGLVCTIQPATALIDMLGKTHVVTFASGVIVDSEGQAYAGISGTNFQFSIGDHTTPKLLAFSPLQGAHNVAVDSTFSFTFSEDVLANASGTITLTPQSAGSPIVYGASSAQVTINNAVVTLTLSVNLVNDETYTVSISSGAFTDANSPPNGMPPLFGSSYLFRVTIKMRIIFSQDVQAGTGLIRIFTASGNVGTDITVTDTARVQFSGNIMTLTPIGVAADTEYYMSVGKDVITDTAGTPHGFAGTAFHFNANSGDHYLQFRYT